MISKNSHSPNPLSRDGGGLSLEGLPSPANTENPALTTGAETSQQASLPFLQMAMNLAKPLQLVFSIRKRTQQAKGRIQELQSRVDRLEASIEQAKGQSHMGQRFDKLR